MKNEIKKGKAQYGSIIYLGHLFIILSAIRQREAYPFIERDKNTAIIVFCLSHLVLAAISGIFKKKRTLRNKLATV